MASAREHSIVEYYAEHEGYRCGYCKCSDSNYSHGMWAHSLTVDDYQDLIDRGWRRSGRYCYKPTMQVTCCPMYTIKCAALEVKLTKSQKKVLKRVHRFLAHGDVKQNKGHSSLHGGSRGSETEGVEETAFSDTPELHPKALGGMEKSLIGEQPITMHSSLLGNLGLGYLDGVISDSLSKISSLAGDAIAFSLESKREDEDTKECDNKKPLHRPGVGPDVSRPPSKKAKLIRLEHKQQKLLGQGLSKKEAELIVNRNKLKVTKEKSLEDFINEPLPDMPAHRLETRLVATGSAEFNRSLAECQDLYAKYQIAVHGEKPEECNAQAFYEFLVVSPLKNEKTNGNTVGPPQGYGSFHQQYWLDGHLVAVGVIDILPKCISSVYFYYEPDLGHLSLGTYASLQELFLTRSLHQHAPNLQFYYMGFYIHTCPKMRYKASYCPSFLLCPEAYTWNSIEKCLEKLDHHKYSRLDDNLDATDPNLNIDINQVLVLSHQRAMPYRIYKMMERNANDADEITQYATLVGMKCASRMLLARN